MKIRQLILEKIIELGEGTLDAFFPEKYPEARIWRNLLGLENNYKFSRANFSRTLSGLNKQGLIERRGPNKKSIWKPTEKGREYLKSISKKNFSLQEDGGFRLVAFDIPEEERGKRQWLRGRLSELRYTPIQRSVWVGKTILPKEFIDELKKINIKDYLHVFDVIERYSE